MFHSLSDSIIHRMKYLEEIDAKDRENGTPRLQRLRQVSPETGKFLALLAASAPAGKYVEIGTSAGYSTLWLALACQAVGRTISTFEVLPEKAVLARQTFEATEMQSVIELVEGDARKFLAHYDQIAFCFLDAEKDIYADCYELVVPRMLRGGLLIADNAINHREPLQPMLDRALNDRRVDAVVVPIGGGELVCRKI